MFFIVSTGRSGTKNIAQILSQVDGISCLHEPPPELILESSAYHYGEYSRSEIEELFKSTRPKSTDISLYCEFNQTLSLLMPIIRNVFPESRFIWLVRNGLDFVASAMQKQWYSGHSENHVRYVDCTPTQKAWIDGRITGDRCGDMSSKAWELISRFEKCCWYWSYINKLIETDMNANRNIYYLLRLEHIRTQLPKLIKWMGVESGNLPSITPSNFAKRPPYHWTKWTFSEKEKFTQYCGGQMDRLYPEWRLGNGQWKSVKYETPPVRHLSRFAISLLKNWYHKIHPRADR